jgi:L-lactate dehydrogenase complex protein LldG
MATSLAKENILRKIRQALSNPVPLPFAIQDSSHLSVFKNPTEDDAVLFAENFKKIQGKFSFCNNEADLLEQLYVLLQSKKWEKVFCKEDAMSSLLQKINQNKYSDLATCDVSITGCEYLVARTGTIVMSTAQQSGRTTSVYAPVHICIAYTSQLVFDLKDALSFLKTRYTNNFPSLITFASGPSRTADIEKTLVTGVHGPKEVYCFLVEF